MTYNCYPGQREIMVEMGKAKVKDEIGNRYSRLTVLERAGSRNGRAAWLCQCDCGEYAIVPGKYLRNGRTQSCGCLRRERLSAASHPSGPGHPNWKGGISHDPYGPGFTDRFKDIVRKRDLYCCQVCGLPQEEEQTLHVHHIDYDKTNTTMENCITLCRSCHMKTNYNREYWYNYFMGTNEETAVEEEQIDD